MKGSPAVQAAARRILAGDDSMNGASALESAILLDHGDDEHYDELIWVLSMYSPRGGSPYTGVDELRAEIVSTLGVPDSSAGP